MSAGLVQHEHEFEATEGLPEALPEGERVLWQGAPEARELAFSCFHLKAFALYFAVLLAARAGFVLADGGSLGAALLSLPWMAVLAAAALGVVATLAWLSARTTRYTITDRRVVMRIGIVLTVTFNLPFSRIASADIARRASGTGDVALRLEAGERIAIVHLWPHARPWRLVRPEPMLRGIADVERVGAVLSEAWRASRIEATTAAAVPLRAVRRTPANTGASIAEPIAA